MSLADKLDAPQPPNREDRDKPAIPSANTPGSFTWDGTHGTFNTPPMKERPTTWDTYLKEALPDEDPANLEVIEPVSVRGWQVQQKMPDGTTELRYAHYFRFNVQRRRKGPPIEDLLSLVKKSKPNKDAKRKGQETFVIALGDLQLGKKEGTVEDTINRVTGGIDRAVKRYKETPNVGPIHLAWLGDCIEGFVSQGGANSWRTTLTLTEQIRLLRRLMFYAIEQLAPLTNTLSVVAVPGNHDQAHRINGKGVTRYDDSFDVDALAAVADALLMNPATYSHVVCHTPAKDELTVTLKTANTIIGHAHGHMWNPKKHMQWWEGQSFGDQSIGEADILFAGHLHHLHIEQSGRRTFVQVPALEEKSQWVVHKRGQVGAPAILIATVLDGKIDNIGLV